MKAFINESIKEIIPETGNYDGNKQLGMVRIEVLQESEDRRQKTEDRRHKSEEGRRKLEVGIWKTEVRSRKLDNSEVTR